MEHSVEKLSSNKVKISFKATAAEFENALQQAYLKLRGQINVPGFRKGKAPRKLIETMYGEGVFYDDAFQDILFPEAYYDEAVKENDLQARRSAPRWMCRPSASRQGSGVQLRGVRDAPT